MKIICIYLKKINLYIFLLIIHLPNILFSQSDFNDLVKYLDNKDRLTKTGVNKLFELKIKDSTSFIFFYQTIEKYYVVNLIDIKSQKGTIFRYNKRRKKISKQSSFYNNPIGLEYDYQNNKIINHDSLFLISIDSVISTVNNVYKIDLQDLNEKNQYFQNRTKFPNALRTPVVEILRVFNPKLLTPHYLIRSRSISKSTPEGFQLLVDGKNGDIVFQNIYCYNNLYNKFFDSLKTLKITHSLYNLDSIKKYFIEKYKIDISSKNTQLYVRLSTHFNTNDSIQYHDGYKLFTFCTIDLLNGSFLISYPVDEKDNYFDYSDEFLSENPAFFMAKYKIVEYDAFTGKEIKSHFLSKKIEKIPTKKHYPLD
jgi:hypothetical protein